MRPILIFSGTEEGNRLARQLTQAGIPCVVSVAEEYGMVQAPELMGAELWNGRLTEEEIRSLARQKEVYAVVDATAPGAEDVSRDIRAAVEKLRTVSGQAEELARRLQELRPEEDSGKRETRFSGKVLYIRLLSEKSGERRGRGSSLSDVLRELQQLTGVRIPGVDEREPAGEGRMSDVSIRRHENRQAEKYEDLLDEDVYEDLRLGGVFDEEERERAAGDRGYDGGQQLHRTGRVREQDRESGRDRESDRGAARDGEAGGGQARDRSEVKSDRKPSKLETMWELERRVNSWIPTMLETGKEMPMSDKERTRNYNRILQTYKGHGKPVFPRKSQNNVVDYGSAVYTHHAVEIPNGDVTEKGYDGQQGSGVNNYFRADSGNIRISLIGMGMGGPGSMTVEAERVLQGADYVYGPGRLLEHIPEKQHPKALVHTDDILFELGKLDGGKAAVLFSGDTGFYSGCRDMVQLLWNSGYQNIQIYPGVSAVSYFAALCGIGWEDAGIVSACEGGGVDAWGAEALSSILHHEKTFLLMSGASDMRQLGLLLEEQGLQDCQIFVGYELSGPGEKTVQLTAEECRQLREEGQYVCLVRNYAPRPRRLAAGLRVQTGAESSGESGLSPEVRSLVLRRLELTEYAAVCVLGRDVAELAVEVAVQSPTIRVYAVAEEPGQIRRLQDWCREQNILNVDIITGEAHETIENLKMPTHVLISGGSQIGELLQMLYRKNPWAIVVLTLESLELIGELTALEKAYPLNGFQVTQLQVGQLRKAGEYHRIESRDPVYVASFAFGGEQ